MSHDTKKLIAELEAKLPKLQGAEKAAAEEELKKLRAQLDKEIADETSRQPSAATAKYKVVGSPLRYNKRTYPEGAIIDLPAADARKAGTAVERIKA